MGVMRKRASRARGRPTVEDRIVEAIDGLRLLLHFEAGRIELVEFRAETGVATMRLEGDCPDCDMPAAAFLRAIEAHLRQRVPEVRHVRTPGAPAPGAGADGGADA
jgi:Fe-S cluster biogenesis protein NfuA